MLLFLRLLELPGQQQLAVAVRNGNIKLWHYCFICTRFSCSLHQQPIQQLPVIFLCTLELARRQQLAIAARREKAVCLKLHISGLYTNPASDPAGPGACPLFSYLISPPAAACHRCRCKGVR